ncbi:MAG: L-threonylcarbamoyladenylate synthase [Candidatus Korobacteraceae bacterium]
MERSRRLSYTAMSHHRAKTGDVIICSVAVYRSNVLGFRSASTSRTKEVGLRPEIVKINSKEPEASLVTYAAEKIRAGEVLGMPTDTYYGLAVDPFNLHAVDRVYDIKTRSRHKPLSLLIESVDQAAELAWPVPEIFYLLARRFWPGPLTIIVKADPKLPLKVTANTGNVALRVPAAEVPLAIIRSAGLPITATSANLHGEVECATAMQVRDQLGDCLSIIVDGGPSPGVMPSTIVDLTTEGSWRLLRHGTISEEQIVELLGRE